MKKKPPLPGDWLETQKELGQSFESYFKSNKSRAFQNYQAIYIQPLGDFLPSVWKIVEQTAEFMGEFFGLPIRFLATYSLTKIPKSAKRTHPQWNVPQILSTYLLERVLLPNRPADAMAVLGLTGSDLWPGKNWNFVFGQASLSDRVGVWSIFRNGDLNGTAEEKKLFLRRTLKTSVHETGHMLAIPHCIAYECGMNGSNSLEESDRQPFEFCGECQAKISWTCGCDWKSRYQKLAKFGREQGFQNEVTHWEASLAALED